MSVARWSVSRPVAVTMRIAALVLLGAISFFRIPIDLLPQVDLPIVAVNTSWPNTPPQEMETQITRPVEQAVSTIPGLYSISSNSNLGSSSVRVTLNYGVDIDKAAVDVLQYVQRAYRQFPNDPNISPPTVFKFDPNSFPVLIYGVTGIEDPIELRTLLVNEIAPMIESAGGVAQVSVSGGRERAVIINVDPVKMQAYNVLLPEIVTRIRAENISQPAGIAKAGEKEYVIRSSGYFKSIADAENMPIRTTDGRQVLLKQVATIKDEAREQRVWTRMNGENAVGLAITKQREANTIDTAKSVEKVVAEIKKAYPQLSFRVGYDQSGFVKDSVHLLQEHAVIGGTLAILAILFFLRNFRSTFVVALSIPISITSTFSLMYFGGFTLNTISLSALALATGLIVDDAIVVLENIFRHIERDKRTPVDAAVTGTQEIMQAVVASTITVMIVFVPLFLIKGQSGQIFTQLALVVIFSLAVSLLDAATVVPMLASRLIKAREVHDLEHPEEQVLKKGIGARISGRMGLVFNAVDTGYRNALEKVLGKRWLVLAGVLLLTVAVYPLWLKVGSETLPKTDSGDLNVRVRLPVGTALSTTIDKMGQVEEILLADPDIDTVFVSVGAGISFRGGVGGEQANSGAANVHLKPNRTASTEDIAKRLDKKMQSISGIRATSSPFDLVSNIIGGNNQGMEISVFGTDLETIALAANQVKDALSDVPGLEGVDVNFEEATPELTWTVDRQKAQTLGVSYQDIASAINASTNGTLSTYFQDKGFQYPIYVQIPQKSRESVEDLMRIPIKKNPLTGTQIYLGQVATPALTGGPNGINRINRRRTISVGGRYGDLPESGVLKEVQARMDQLELPTGITWAFGERQVRKADEFSGMGMAVLLAIALVYMLLASQFESFIYPLVVLTTVPLCVIGVVMALFLSGRSFGLTAFIGLLMLVGIVVKNGILLVEYTNQLRGRGMNRHDAILLASPTRLRPILMTSIASVLGMMPLALATGSASALQAPLATVVVGGLTTSTILTLFVVPVVYTFFDDLARMIRKEPRDLAHADGVEPTPASVGASVGVDD
ncbi:MAG: efflux RND transporter permease subunit [Fimbriimonadaceae bacterium]